MRKPISANGLVVDKRLRVDVLILPDYVLILNFDPKDELSLDFHTLGLEEVFGDRYLALLQITPLVNTTLNHPIISRFCIVFLFKLILIKMTIEGRKVKGRPWYKKAGELKRLHGDF